VVNAEVLVRIDIAAVDVIEAAFAAGAADRQGKTAHLVGGVKGSVKQTPELQVMSVLSVAVQDTGSA